MGTADDMRQGLRAVRDSAAARRLRARLAQQLAFRAVLPPRRFEIGVHLGGGPLALARLRWWYGPLAELAKTHPLVVLSRDAATTSILLEECPLPVAELSEAGSLEAFLAEQPLRVVLHLEHGAETFGMLAHGRRWHVHLDPGEGEGASPNQVKSYDAVLVAGDAAAARLEREVWGFDATRVTRIGRPQLDQLGALPLGHPDHLDAGAPQQDAERTTVLYAPTGASEPDAAHLGSVATHGVAIARAVLASPAHRLVYWPESRATGVAERGARADVAAEAAHAAAHREIVALVAAAAERDPAAGHRLGAGPDAVRRQAIATAEFAIVDIAPAVYDRLATAAPMLVTRPEHPDARIDTTGFLSDCAWLGAGDAPQVLARLDELERDSAAGVRLGRWVTHYFGDTRAGAATRRFRGAIESLLAEADTTAARQESERIAAGLTALRSA
ncbi:hypothetical protein VD659_13805 [Herbiconiux sp. 11R-BC]|uniref:hypothetical protein n=1 Tax=Herbiconiux sp. 11R-BC TaxID=3111637 RepID=UPI003C033717